MSTKVYSRDEMAEEMRRVYAGNLATAKVSLRFTSEIAGGQPASEAGVRAFAQHHLKLTGNDLEEAVQRILTKEVRKDQPSDEVKEVETYGLNILRRTEKQIAYVGTWQVRAMLKQSASRLGLLEKKKGSKGDLAEAMVVRPDGASAVGGQQEIGLILNGKPFTERRYHKFMGSVSGPSGRVSIVHDSEVAPVGSEIHFTIQWPTKKITPDDMAAVLGRGENIGLGSVKSLEMGRFEVIRLEIQEDDKPKTEEEQAEKLIKRVTKKDAHRAMA